LFLGALALVLSILFLPETYVPIILVGKAREARKRTNNWAIYAPHENIEVDLKQLVVKYLARPLVMLVTEPVLFVVSFYMSFIYALLYLFFEAYPLVFEGVYGFNAGIAGLPFFALGIGVLGSCLMSVLIAPSYNRKLAANHHVAVPEWRLPQVILGGVVFTVGLFWFGWTGRRASMHWIVPTLSGILTGFGIVSIFMPLMNFILDMYPTFAASAISAATIMRSAVAAAFPPFAAYMYDGLGIGLASTVLGCVAAALVPVPVTLYFYGPKLRQRSKLVLNQKA
jgi:MFS transporter, DHA1 family, multidrug resistance protein